MENKIKVLFINRDQYGINYFRSLTPAMEIERNHKNIVVELNANINITLPETLDYLKSFDIIHYHGYIVESVNKMRTLAHDLKAAGVKLVMDIDDFWIQPDSHPLGKENKSKKTHLAIIEHLKIADYVTTTTEVFAAEIRKITQKDNVVVLANGIDTDWMKQFQNNWKPDSNGLVRIVYMGGSTHLEDLKQLTSVFNILNGDTDTKGKFKVILAGWDTVGVNYATKFNEEFGEELKKLKLWNKKTLDIINKTKGNVDAIPRLPVSIADKYRGNVFTTSKEDKKSIESVYFQYEKILTDNFYIIKDQDYLNWLMNFDKFNKYGVEGNYARRWTQKANIYASVLDEADIVLAPLEDNFFNKMKSNIKQVESITRKLPIVCSDVEPYNVDGKNMENCILIKNAKNSHKDWVKALKKLILDADLRKQLGENLYNDISEKYNLKNVTKTRVDFYEKII